MQQPSRSDDRYFPAPFFPGCGEFPTQPEIAEGPPVPFPEENGQFHSVIPFGLRLHLEA